MPARVSFCISSCSCYCSYLLSLHMAKEAQKPRRKKRFSYVSSVISIAMVLLMLGLFGMLLIESQKISTYIRENLEIEVFFQEELPQQQVNEYLDKIRKAPYTSEAKYISKEIAAAEFSRETGQDFVSFLGYNPLMPSIQLRLKAGYTSQERLAAMEQELKTLQGVKEIAYPKTVFEQVDRNVTTIGSVLLGLAALFIVIAITLINSTVRLNLYAQRFLIKSMQLVGATKWFILRPFVFNALLNGVIGAVLAILLICGILYALPYWVDRIDSMYDMNAFTVLFAFLVLLGMAISMLSSLWSTNRYLKSRIEELY